MNYLAHAALAEPTDEARLGSLLGDFRRGLELERLPQATRHAIEEHQAVDVWFDSHPLVRAERAAFPPHLRRFAGILIDVFADHFLVLHWETLGPAPLKDVTQSLYRALECYRDVLPPRLVSVAPHMAAHDWLGSYGEETNIEKALAGIARRLSRPTPILEGMDVLRERRAHLQTLVLAVFPEALAWTAQRRQG